MNRKRMIQDFARQFITYLSSGISAFILIAIFIFIFSRGWETLNWKLLTNQYNSENLLAEFSEAEQPGNFERPRDLAEDSYFSEKYGIAFKDEVSADKDDLMTVTYLAKDSPLQEGKIKTAGAEQGKILPLDAGLHLKKLSYLDENGEKRSAGLMTKEGKTAAEMVEVLDQKAASVVDFYAQTEGGGLRGSIVTTLLLILITLLLALPIGICAAIYLNELAPKNHLTNLLRSSIELLAGVPSIIFGLMGMTMLFPITKLMGINGQSILLGAMTLAVILLPVIIRQTEEALINVPDGMRMASLSLGATSFQTIRKVVLPNALPGILTATLLSISRIIGESAALIFTIGTAITDNPAWNSKGTSLAVHIYTVMGGEQPNFELASAISIVILLLVLILNVAVKIITYYMTREKSDKPKRKKDKSVAALS